MTKNWKTYKLDEISHIKGGKRLPKGDILVNTKTQHPYIRVTDMGNRKIPLNQLMHVPDITFPKIARYIVNTDDVIISIVGTIGSVALIDKDLNNANLTENCVKLTKLKDVEPEFLYYYLISEKGQNEIKKGVVGSTQPKLPLYNIQNIEISLPPISEQRTMASILSTLDDKIELNLQQNKTMEEMAMALYKHWFVDFGPFKDGKFVESELGMIPKGWEIGKLKDCIDINPSLKLVKGKVAPFVEMKALPTDSMSVPEIDYKSFSGGSKFQNGDILFARITPCLENGKTAYVDFLEESEVAFGSTEFLVLRANEFTSQYYIYLISREETLRKHAISCMVGTSGRQRVQTEPFLNFSIPIAPKNVHEEFSFLVSDWFKLIRSNTLENQTLKQQRDTLLPKLISGEIRVKGLRTELNYIL